MLIPIYVVKFIRKIYTKLNSNEMKFYYEILVGNISKCVTTFYKIKLLKCINDALMKLKFIDI